MSGNPLSKSDTIFALALASAIKSGFNVELGEEQFLLTSPLVMRGMAAGNLVYPQLTNYFIYKFADSLQYADSPSYYGASAGSYLQQLERYAYFYFLCRFCLHSSHHHSYITWIKPVNRKLIFFRDDLCSNGTQWQNRDVSVEVALRLAEARDNFRITTNRYNEVEDEAAAEWFKVRKDYPDLEFFDWADLYYPALKTARDFRTKTYEELIKAMGLYFGTEAETLTGYVNGISSAFNRVSSLPE